MTRARLAVLVLLAAACSSPPESDTATPKSTQSRASTTTDTQKQSVTTSTATTWPTPPEALKPSETPAARFERAVGLRNQAGWCMVTGEVEAEKALTSDWWHEDFRCLWNVPPTVRAR